MLSTDLVYEKVESNYCEISKHTPPSYWDRFGDGKIHPICFYKIKSKDRAVNGKIVCDCCVVIARWLAKNS
jgi:hypothetical protein